MSKPGSVPRREDVPEERGFRLVGEVDGRSLDFVLQPGDNTIGALPDNDFAIANSGVSRRHAVISWTDGAVSVTDRASKNGTLVNGVRIEQGSVKVGDLICFGPATLRLERATPGDVVPVVGLRPKRWGGGDPHPDQVDADTPTTNGEGISQRWFGALDRISDILAADRTAGTAASLEVLRSALGAAGVALIAWDQSSDLRVVRHTAGDFRPPADLAAVLTPSAAPRRAARGRGLEVRSHIHEGTAPLALAIASGDGARRHAVVAVGEFPMRKACGRFLELYLKLVLRNRASRPASGTVRVRRPVADLVFPDGYIAGRSEPMLRVYDQLRHLLGGDLPILITGETGVGKEYIARILHASSHRSGGPFVAVNCAALPADLLEAELFGIEGGVATGVSAREGKMQLARGGIVFLDEIGDMSPALQAKLLRALQEREVHPIGARQPVALDVRILAATNTDLKARIGEGRFRSDLYYRIAGYTLPVPPLRERRGDIPALIEAMVQRVASEIDKPIRGLTVKALEALVNAPWPGNVRELEHEVRRLVYLSPPDEPITVAMVSAEVREGGGEAATAPNLAADDLILARHVEALERRLITLALERAGGKRTAAARLLGVTRYGLALKMQRLGLGD
jgi:DNA-binding NtrC family response regulator